jgi:hypothetical protein
MTTQPSNTVLVTRRHVYGRDVFYPANVTARLAVDLARTSTITAQMISTLKAYHYTVTVVAESEEL